VGPEPVMDRVAAALPAVLGEVRRDGAPT
jgi:hypothetical protein